MERWRGKGEGQVERERERGGEERAKGDRLARKREKERTGRIATQENNGREREREVACKR